MQQHHLPPPSPSPPLNNGGVNQQYNISSPMAAYPTIPKTQHTQRHSAAGSPYILTPTHAPGPAASPRKPLSKQSPSKLGYQHNTVIAIFLGTPLFFILWNSVSPAPLQIFLFASLFLYAVDLACLQEMYMIVLWIGFALLSMTNGWTHLMSVEDHEASGYNMVLVIMKLMVETLLFLCMACCGTLQASWLYKESAVLVKMVEHVLHAALVPISSAVLVAQTMPLLVEWVGTDRTATIMPHYFALLLMAAMLSLGCAQSKNEFCISFVAAKVHVIALLLVPGCMHVSTFYRRILSSYASADEWYDLVLVWTIPYLMLYIINVLEWNGMRKGPYATPLLFGQSTSSTLRGAFLPILVSVAASLAAQQKYLIPLCQRIAYNFHGHDLPSNWVVSSLLTVAVLSSLFAAWVYGRKSTVTNELLFGDYHDDVVQLALALSGMLAGKAMGMPWSLTPLPILAFLGLVIWMTTRMLRYLVMLMFVIHSTGMVVWSYRYAGIDSTIALAIPGLSLNLFRFGMFSVSISMMIFVTMGLSVRSSGGFGHQYIRRFDMTGLSLLVYTLLQTVLECTMLKHPVPFHNLMGVETHDAEVDAMIYRPSAAYLTSVAVFAIGMFLYRYNIISAKTSMASLSLAVGKVAAVYIDANSGMEVREDSKVDAMALLLRTFVASSCLFAMVSPRAFLEPIHFKVSRRVSANFDIPRKVGRVIIVYALVLLPMTLVASVPFVVRPLVGILSGRVGGGLYYSVAPAFSETFGFAAAMWGLSLLSMLNHYLPDGGGETWKKAAALAFIMGLGVGVSAPTVPDWMLSKSAKGSPYASMSSLGSKIQGKSRAGGWGLVSASLATLLSITGPLDLQEKTEKTGKKDHLLLFRMMVFSVMFGCGTSWFITLQSMSEEAFLPVFLTSTACMAMSFFGTVAGVLGYFLELENFDEALDVVTVFVGAFPIFGITAGISLIARESAHPFGIGGWLSTYLAVNGIVTLGLSIVLRSRTAKSSVTRGVGNSSCIVSWLCWIVVLYGRYGVAGLDASYDVTTTFGLPASVMGTFVVSLILLLLEGESSSSSGRGGRGRGTVGSTNTVPTATPWHCVNFQSLNSSNSLAPPVASVAVVLLVGSAYAIFTRGCGFLDVATSHTDVFHNLFGKNSAGFDDLSTLAEKNMIHSNALMTSAKLAGASFWTAPSLSGPLLHTLGLAVVAPSLWFLVNHLWGNGTTNVSLVTLCIPLNLIALFICRGIPTLRAAGLVGLVGGTMQVMNLRGRDHRSKMRI